MLPMQKSRNRLGGFRSLEIAKIYQKILRYNAFYAIFWKSYCMYVVFCSLVLILCPLKESTSWPVSLISAFLEDSLLHRTWTDDPLCTNVVQAVLIGIGANVGAIKGTMQTVTKFNDSEKMVELRSQILKSIEDKVKQLTSKCSIASSSNIGEMKRLASCLEQLSTIPEVRYLACRSIAFLLQIPTLKTLGKKLLSSICQVRTCLHKTLCLVAML